MGQAQKSRQQNVQYRDVELWELYEDGSGRAYNARSRGKRAKSSRKADQELNIMLYEERGAGRERSGRQSRDRYPRRELQIQDISRGAVSGRQADGQRNRRNKAQMRYREDAQTGCVGGLQTAYGGGAQAVYAGRSQTAYRGGAQAGRMSRSQAAYRGGAQAGRMSRSQAAYRDGAQAGRMSRSQAAYRGSARPVQSLRRRKAKKRKAYLARFFTLTMVALCFVLIYIMTGKIYRQIHEREDHRKTLTFSEKIVKEEDTSSVLRPAVTEDFLEINDFSRPGTELKRINNIFVHYTANPGTSAAQNRSYFANLALTQERSASAHLIIGYEGEIIQCIPFDEQAYAVVTRNEDSISIECCYVEADGSFTQETYDSLIHTLAWLTDQYDLSTEDILRHYDCGGKKCPIYYVEHEDAWNHLLKDVEAYRQTCKTEL